MSGHSKWATIKRQKGANDVKRGALFTKLSNAIAIAVRQGGNIADPESNFRLRLAIEAARNANMPKENIERVVERAAGKSAQAMEEAVYEGFGPGGFSVVVEAFTDNKLRTVSEVKNLFNKNGGTIGNQGSVLYQFTKKGVITVAKGGRSPDDIFMLAVDCGADDVEESEDEVLIYTQPEELAKVRDELVKQQIQIKNAELTFEPVVTSPIVDKDAAQRALDFVDKLESMDDVQKVFANFDIPDEIMQTI